MFGQHLDVGFKIGILLAIIFDLFEDFQWNGPKRLERFYDLTTDSSATISIHVFAWRRKKSLERLCKSLLEARYLGHDVPIFFHVDGDPLDLVVDYLNEFEWPHGEKHVEIRSHNLGMPDVVPLIPD